MPGLFGIGRSRGPRQEPYRPIHASMLNATADAAERLGVSVGLAAGLESVTSADGTAIRVPAKGMLVGKVTTAVSARSSGTTYTDDGRVTLMADDPAAGQLVEVVEDFPVYNFKKVGFVVGAYLDLAVSYGRLFVVGPNDCSDIA